MVRRPAPSVLRRQKERHESQYGRVDWKTVRTKITRTGVFHGRAATSTGITRQDFERARMALERANVPIANITIGAAEVRNFGRPIQRFTEMMGVTREPPEPKVSKTSPELLAKYPANKFQHEHIAEPIRFKDLYCCGVKEIHGIQYHHRFLNIPCTGNYTYEPLSVLEILTQVRDLYANIGNNRPFLIFTDNDNSRKGEVLAVYIEEHKLGTVQRSQLEYNPNSGNRIVVYVWAVNAEALLSYKPPKG